MHNIIILGGGFSMKSRDIPSLRHRAEILIGVNDAALLAECDYGLSMDRLWAENRYEAVLAQHPHLQLWLRDAAMKNIAPVPARMHKFMNDHTSCAPTTNLHQINGSNSGTVALNFALQMLPDTIYLLGFDMQKGPNGEPYWYPPYPWAIPEGGTSPGKYRQWVQEFDEIHKWAVVRGIKIINVNHRSAITCFPTWTWEQFIAAI